MGVRGWEIVRHDPSAQAFAPKRRAEAAILPMNLTGLISVPALGAALASGNFSGWRDMGWGG
jgi:hypothetical protein